jgi:6-phosphofructokinase 1
MLARQKEGDGPHLIYLPEVPFTIERFTADVKKAVEKSGRCVVAVSEGIRDAEGNLWAAVAGQRLFDALKDDQKNILGKPKQDAFGHYQLSGTGVLADYLTARIKEAMDVGRVRGDTFGYLQRSFPGLASKTDAREARMVGRDAVKAAYKGDVDGSIAIRRAKGRVYKVHTERVPLEAVAGKNREVPKEYISADGNDILESFRAYCLPLAGELPETALLE